MALWAARSADNYRNCVWFHACKRDIYTHHQSKHHAHHRRFRLNLHRLQPAQNHESHWNWSA